MAAVFNIGVNAFDVLSKNRLTSDMRQRYLVDAHIGQRVLVPMCGAGFVIVDGETNIL